MPESEKNEILTSNGHQIEKSVVGDVPAEVAMPTQGERLVVGAEPNTETENGKSGLEVVSLAEFPRDANGNIEYDGTLLGGNIQAILIDPAVKPDFKAGTGFKGLRQGEIVSSETLAKRFGKEAGFTIGLDQEGKVMVENMDPSRSLDILSIKPIEQQVDVADMPTLDRLEELVPVESSEAIDDAAEASEELHEEAAEDMGEISAKELVEIDLDIDAPEPNAAEPVESETEAVIETNVAEVVAETPVEADMESEEEEPAHEKLEEPTAFEKIAQAKAEYDQQVDSILENAENDANNIIRAIEGSLDEAANYSRTGINMLSDDVQALRTLASRLEGGDYNNEMARTKLNQLVETVQGAYNRFSRAESSLNDVRVRAAGSTETFDEAKSALEVKDYSFAGLVHEAISREAQPQLVEVPGYSTEAATGTLTAINAQIDEIGVMASGVEGAITETAGTLRKNVNHLNDILSNSYRTQIEAQELRSIAAQLQAIIEADPARTLSSQAEEKVAAVKQSVRLLTAA